MTPKNECELYEMLLCGHLDHFISRLRRLSVADWDWTPHVAAPTARTLAVHGWQWLMCDRQHILQPDITLHLNVAEPEHDTSAFCDAFQAETEEWRTLLRTLQPEDLDREINQFGSHDATINVRGYIGHMIQNLIYKHGQFAEIYFALGYDGDAPYSAPFPNPIYEEVRSGSADSE